MLCTCGDDPSRVVKRIRTECRNYNEIIVRSSGRDSETLCTYGDNAFRIVIGFAELSIRLFCRHFDAISAYCSRLMVLENIETLGVHKELAGEEIPSKDNDGHD